MPSREIYLRIHRNRIYFNNEISIEASNSNLPVKEVELSAFRNIYWEIEQISFNKETEELTARVLNYFSKPGEQFQEQTPKCCISKIHFENLWDAENLKNCLLQYQHIVKGAEDKHQTAPELLIPEDYKSPKSKGRSIYRSEAAGEHISKEFKIDFNDAEVKLGYISFEKYFAEIKDHITFKIQNDFLLPEFDLIKFYFSKALGSKKFDVKASIVVQGEKSIESSASSVLISKINENILETVKSYRAASLSKHPININIDKSIFTSDDIFDNAGDGIKGNILDQSELEILNSLLEKHNVRNKKQLQFLAGFMQSPDAKLRFTLHPYFGFLFTIAGERMNHFVWELLNTHATYLWSFDKGELEGRLQYRRVEDAINQVRAAGRDHYKMAFAHSHLDDDLIFHSIRHEDAGSDMIDGFVKWRHRLIELLV